MDLTHAAEYSVSKFECQDCEEELTLSADGAITKKSKTMQGASSGASRRARVTKALRRIKMKIRRWKRYQKDETKRWSKPVKPEKGEPKPPKRKWRKTDGLEREQERLEKVLRLRK